MSLQYSCCVACTVLPRKTFTEILWSEFNTECYLYYINIPKYHTHTEIEYERQFPWLESWTWRVYTTSFRSRSKLYQVSNWCPRTLNFVYNVCSKRLEFRILAYHKHFFPFILQREADINMVGIFCTNHSMESIATDIEMLRCRHIEVETK